MCYRLLVYFLVIYWGQYNEDKVIEVFFKCKCFKYKKFKIQRCGVILCDKNLIIVVLLDVIVSCFCCGDRLLEVKNFFIYRNLLILDYIKQLDFCFYFIIIGEINLKCNYDYYY